MVLSGHAAATIDGGETGLQKTKVTKVHSVLHAPCVPVTTEAAKLIGQNTGEAIFWDVACDRRGELVGC